VRTRPSWLAPGEEAPPPGKTANSKLKEPVMKRHKMLIPQPQRRVCDGLEGDGGKDSASRSRIGSGGATSDPLDRRAETGGEAAFQTPTPGDTPARQRLECNWVDERFSIRLHTLWPRGFTPQGIALSLRDWVERTAGSRNFKDA